MRSNPAKTKDPLSVLQSKSGSGWQLRLRKRRHRSGGASSSYSASSTCILPSSSHRSSTTLITSSSSSSSLTVNPSGRHFLVEGTPTHMPPGPPSSPAPSPAGDECSNNQTITSNSDESLPVGVRQSLRRRRNAISGTSTLGRHLEALFTSYMVANLSDSMTSALSIGNRQAKSGESPLQFVTCSASSSSSGSSSSNRLTPLPTSSRPEMETD